jgi:D-sedoheptulose 7-phosphate isomerase
MINELISRYPTLAACRGDIESALAAIIECYEKGGKILLCGNGGSCADCDHIVGELMKGFLKSRRLGETQKKEMIERCARLDDSLLSGLQGGLPAISLASFTALNTAFCNDENPELIYAQALLGLAKENDILIGISTSGGAKNVNAAAKVALGLGMKVISLTGEKGGALAELATVAIKAPETETFKVQELHLPIYHCLCAAVEEHFFKR